MKRIFSLIACAVMAVGLAACSSSESSGPDFNEFQPLTLNQSLSWYGENREKLDEMILAHGVTSENYDPKNPPIAVFDWDNTIIKNDIGDATTFWMIKHNLILQPANKDWSKVSPLLTTEALAALKVACDNQAEPGKPLMSDHTNAASRACADEIVSVYYNIETTDGDDAFLIEPNNTIEPAYAFAAQLQAGYTPAEINAIAKDVVADQTAQEIGAVQTVGTGTGYNGYIRIYDQIRDLISVLQNHGFDVWVLSASPQSVVEPFAAKVGIAADHVIGIRAVIQDNKLTATFQGCGNFPDGNTDLITYYDGKRCWINKVIFGVTDPVKQLESSTGVVFVAGDSDTDLSMLKDAQYKLVINRNKTELMCHAYYNDDGQGNWLINPMFIKPKPQVAEPYACEEYGIPNQVDTVF